MSVYSNNNNRNIDLNSNYHGSAINENNLTGSVINEDIDGDQTEIKFEEDEFMRRVRRYEKIMEQYPLAFKGYNSLRDKTMNDERIDELKKAIYDAVSSGKISEVDDLLDMPGADINMTWYSENLLMCAIRFKNEKMAQYLINKGIDVTYEADLIEFVDSKHPINYYMYSCRQMAYDRGMMNIVNLIDIFDKRTDKRIVNYLGKKYIKDTRTSLRGSVEKDSFSLYDKRMRNDFEASESSESGSLFKSVDAQLLDGMRQLERRRSETGNKHGDDNKTSSETYQMLKEADEAKPPSEYNYYDLKDIKSISSGSVINSNKDNKQEKINRRISAKNIQEKVIERVNTLNEELNKIPSLKDPPEIPVQKSLKYGGFKINFTIKNNQDSSDADYYETSTYQVPTNQRCQARRSANTLNKMNSARSSNFRDTSSVIVPLESLNKKKNFDSVIAPEFSIDYKLSDSSSLFKSQLGSSKWPLNEESKSYKSQSNIQRPVKDIGFRNYNKSLNEYKKSVGLLDRNKEKSSQILFTKNNNVNYKKPSLVNKYDNFSFSHSYYPNKNEFDEMPKSKRIKETKNRIVESYLDSLKKIWSYE